MADISTTEVTFLDDALQETALPLELPPGFHPWRSAVSPDGRLVAVGASTSEVDEQLVAVVSAEGTSIIYRSTVGFNRLLWSPDSTSAVFGLSTVEQPATRMMRADLEGNVTQLVDLAGYSFAAPACDDGRTIGYAGGWTGPSALVLAISQECPDSEAPPVGELALLDVQDGTLIRLAEQAASPSVQDGSVAFERDGSVVVLDASSGEEAVVGSGTNPTILDDGDVAFTDDPQPSADGAGTLVTTTEPDESVGDGDDSEVIAGAGLGDIEEVLPAPDPESRIVVEVRDGDALASLVEADGTVEPLASDIIDIAVVGQ